MESVVEFVTQLDLTWVYVAVFLIAYIENIFPPLPSDVIVVFAGSLIGAGEGNIVLTLALATAGSTLGFMSMYQIGKQAGNRILEKGKIKFISPQLVAKVESWFLRYGYWVIIANRFMAGTRAVVSFFAGMSEMNFLRTTLFSAVSSLLWNLLLVLAGSQLGKNWEAIGDYISTYSIAVTIILAVVLAVWFTYFYIKSRRARNGGNAKKGGAAIQPDEAS